MLFSIASMRSAEANGSVRYANAFSAAECTVRLSAPVIKTTGTERPARDNSFLNSAGRATQVDIQDDASGLVEGCAVTKILDVVEGYTIEAVSFQHTVDCTKHTGVIVDNNY
jgi:hypothetical protein